MEIYPKIVGHLKSGKDYYIFRLHNITYFITGTTKRVLLHRFNALLAGVIADNDLIANNEGFSDPHNPSKEIIEAEPVGDRFLLKLGNHKKISLTKVEFYTLLKS